MLSKVHVAWDINQHIVHVYRGVVDLQCHRETAEEGESQRLQQLERHHTALHPGKGVLLTPAKSAKRTC